MTKTQGLVHFLHFFEKKKKLHHAQHAFMSGDVTSFLRMGTDTEA